MSDIGVLSNQYEKLVSTSEKINNSVIAFKKKILSDSDPQKLKHPKLSISPEEIEQAKTFLLSFLENILTILKEDTQQSEYIPSIVLQDYKDRLSRNTYFSEELESLINQLKKSEKIDENKILILDNIMSVLDHERSTLFRKLRTARG